MSNQKKAPFGVFHILKSVMDARAKQLNEQAAAGRRAQTEYPVLCEHIIALRQVIFNCRTFDAAERREAETDLDDRELQLHGIQNRIARGHQAEQDLQYVHKFNETYETVKRIHNDAPRIRELELLRTELQERQSHLDDKIWACEINMDKSARLPVFVEQAYNDITEYKKQYSDLESRITKINETLRQLQK